MSLLTNYEGLRHQIERLVRENQELKKLVQLIRENHELKSAIKTQAGGLAISGFSSGLGEAATSPPQRRGNCVFLPPSPAAANEPLLDEVGIMTLAPLADMLNSPQPGATARPAANPLTGPLSPLLPGPGSLPQSGTLTSLLTGPMAVSPGGTLTSSLGLPSTGPLTPSSHLTGPMAVSPGGTLTSSLGLPSTGPLTPSSHLTGPMAVSPGGTLTSSLGLPSTGPLTPSSALMAPMTGAVAVSLSSPLLTSAAAPLGVSQNLLANPMGNLVLSDPLRGYPSGPHPSAGAGPVATPKVPISTEHPQPTQDLEPFSMTFVGSPIQASTPIGTRGTPDPMTTFSYSSSDAQPQPSAPRGQAVPASVATTPAAPPTAAVLAPPPTPAPQPTANYTPSSTTHVVQCPPQSPTRGHHPPAQPLPTPHSPPRNPHSPPRTSSSPATVSDARGPRGMETSRKSILELERKMAHRKASKFPDSPRESKQLAWERLVGEIAFQLDRRILSSIFPERVRLYGFTVSNIPEKIIQASLNPSDHKLDEELCQTLTQRYVSIMNRLQSLGYNGRVHPALTEQLVNAYGILRERPELAASEGGSYSMDFLQRVLVETVHPSMLSDALLLLSCLSQLAHDDGKPMFIW
ncbi:speriolin isoform X1 [Mustela erminea]|uniref:speriolin isoform X1 n=1 Tax=Mustela erminea TaxID=36723 RepID=UPI001386E8D7|nr:speriolin isoform X1 [Mustela erminea]